MIELSANIEKHPEKALGFEFELFLPEGVPAENTQMIVVPNSRPKISLLEKRIFSFWKSNKKPGQFDGSLPRFEEAIYDGNILKILVSPEKYKSHFFLRTTALPKEYQVQAYSISGIIETKDGKLVTGMRNPKATDQGRIEHVVPAGFINMNELPHAAAIRKLEDELQLSGGAGGFLSESPFSSAKRELKEELKNVKASNMKIIGIIYNSARNFDTTTAIAMKTRLSSSEINPRGKEHENLCFTSTSRKSLKEKFLRLCENPETNSGHLRGCVAALFAHKYGIPTCNSLIEKAILKVSGIE